MVEIVLQKGASENPTNRDLNLHFLMIILQLCNTYGIILTDWTTFTMSFQFLKILTIIFNSPTRCLPKLALIIYKIRADTNSSPQ